jgi:hypothetical protein
MARLLHAMTSDPQASLPNACQGRAELVAAYRFLNNERVTDEEILSPHQKCTLHRLEQHPVVLRGPKG